MVHLIHGDDNNVWWGKLYMWTDCPLSLELVTVFLTGCGAGAIPPPAQERCSPLGSRMPPCSDLDHTAQESLFLPSPGAEGVGELRDMPGLLYSQFPSLPGLPGEVKLVIYSDFSHLVDELRRA